ncbi:MAG: SRPBCC family protein [Deltaproteobacteria bacterium]|nr:SRPBCC family protein [Deltaproteobacteria bacterium]
MAGASKSVEINAPMEKVFSVITDYEKYPEFLDEQSGAKVLSRNGNAVDCEFKLKVIKEITYTLRLTETKPTGLTWTMLKGEMMKSNDGGWKLEDVGGGKTKATYFADIGLGMLVPKSIASMLVEQTLPKTLDAFKKRCEK